MWLENHAHIIFNGTVPYLSFKTCYISYDGHIQSLSLTWESVFFSFCFNSLVTETAHYAGRLKIPCGRRSQALRDRLCASITHIKTATGTRRLNNFNPWTVLRLISGLHFIRPRTLLGLDLVMARVELGKDHEKENLIPNQGEWHQI